MEFIGDPILNYTDTKWALSHNNKECIDLQCILFGHNLLEERLANVIKNNLKEKKSVKQLHMT